MAGSIKDKAEKAGHKIAEKATEVGHKVEENVEKAKDWAKEAAHKVGNRVEEAAQKAEHKAKEVFGGEAEARTAPSRAFASIWMSMGHAATSSAALITCRATSIKLTKNDSADGKHHFIPTSWVSATSTATFI